ncbi:MAG: hypothetical protein P4L46_19340 [Fimbriimonas sp.]|nr:hypothetical protein [Fimbriimonas sp.]
MLGFRLFVAILLSASTTCAVAAKQDPHDSLVFAPGSPVGSRLQYGENVYPSDWSVAGHITESTREEDGLAGFKIVTLQEANEKLRKTAGDEFRELPCEFIGTTPIVTVFAQNGEKHRFLVDSGALQSYVKPSVAESLNNGLDVSFPMALQLTDHRWLHFKVGVDRNVAVLSGADPTFPADGILGMNALACLQLKLDYRHRKAWTRLSAKPLVSAEVSKALGASTKPSDVGSLDTIEMKRQESGRYAISVTLAAKTALVEIDTGANVIGLSPQAIVRLGLTRVGEGSVLVEHGTRSLSMFYAPSAEIGGIPLFWPVVREGVTQDPEVGGIGPSVLPHQEAVIDYPGRTFYTLKPSADEKVEQAASQLLSGVVRLEGKEVVLDVPDIVGKARAVLVKIQDEPVDSVVKEIRMLVMGDEKVRPRLLGVFKRLNTNGHIVIRQNGVERTVLTAESGG